MQENSDSMLTLTGGDLEAVAAHYGVPTNLPVKQKQEAVNQAFADDVLHGDPHWTKEKVARDKKQFLAALTKLHWVSLTCETLGMEEKVVQVWMHTDFDFAAKVRTTQIRMAQRIGHAMLKKALTQDDIGAQMYLIKQFGKTLQWTEQDMVADAPATTSGLDVSKLSVEEQETLLRLMRKANETTVPQIEYIDESDVVEEIPEEEQKFIEQQVDDMLHKPVIDVDD